MYTTLSTVTPPAVEPVSVALARKHCRIDNSDDDDLLAIYVQTARLLAENYLARALITQTLSYAISAAPPTGAWPMTLMAPVILPLWLPYDLFFGRPIQLPRAPVQSIVSVTTTNPDGSVNTLAAGSGYSADVANTPGRLLLAAGARPGYGQDATAVFVAGYGDDPHDVPQQIRTAVLFTTAWLYEHRGDEQLEMPEAAYLLMTPYRLVGFGA